jgi:tripeptidyl-peptidase-1
MYILRTVSSLVILATACAARPTSDAKLNKAVVEKLEGPPDGWVQDASVELDKDTTSITLKVHLVNQNMEKFHDLAMNVRSS